MFSLCELWKCFRKVFFEFESQELTSDIKALLERDIDIDVESLSLLIPDIGGMGACTGLVIRFMIAKHNAFIKLYEEIAQTRFVIMP